MPVIEESETSTWRSCASWRARSSRRLLTRRLAEDSSTTRFEWGWGGDNEEDGGRLCHFELFPAEIEYVARLENLGPDLAAVRDIFGLPALADAPGRPPLNADEGHVNKTRLMHEAPRAIAKLLAYLRQDYACLGYPLPSAARAPS